MIQFPQASDIRHQLMNQVCSAVPYGGSERNVTTIITRPLWRMWCESVGLPAECEPTEWLGLLNTRRVYGSRTIVVESEALAALSYVEE